MRRLINVTGLLCIIFTQTLSFNPAMAADADMSKLHPRFQLLLKENTKLRQIKKTKADRLNMITDLNGEERIGVLIKTRNPLALHQANIRYNSVVNDVVTAKVTLEELKKLSLLSDVEYIDKPTISYPATNVSLAENGTMLLQNGALDGIPYKGKGAIVLIFDTGIDFNHIDFKNPQDTTKSRILFIWDQTNTVTPPSGFIYGTEYTQADINDEIDGSPAGKVQQKDINGHGTHVAGTAAGAGVKFKGAAPEADLIVVKGGDGSFPEDQIIDALNYADQKATQLGKPIVVNLSLGGHDGPHDGSRLYETEINDFCSKAGRVVVVSAGNSGNDEIHRSGTLAASGNTSLQISVPPYPPTSGDNNDDFEFSIWYDGSQTVRAKVTSPNGVVYERLANTSGEASNQNDGRISLTNRHTLGNLTNIILDVYDAVSTSPPAQGTWTLELLDASGLISWDGWLADNVIGVADSQVTLIDGDNEKTVSMPGTAEKAITVAAYVTKITWPSINGNQYQYTDNDAVGGIANFSSKGPTRDGRQKPDIAAPGKGIVATYSSAAEETDVWINPDNTHFLSQGTSMSAPHVSGAAALLLANQPDLTSDQIKSIINNTATKDINTGSVPDYMWGYGKLNILQAVTRQMTPDSMIIRKITNYANIFSGPYYEFSGTEKFAVRYRAINGGLISGAYLTTLINHTDVNPIINGNGNLIFSIHEDSSGFPGAQIGSTVTHPLSLLDPGTENYINLLPAGAEVNASQYYHLVFSLSDQTNSIKLKFDDGSLDLLQNYSEIYLSGQWRKMGQAFSNPYNLLLKSEAIYSDLLNTVEVSPEIIARHYQLFQNFPNPFNPSTKIQFMLTKQSPVDLTIFDVLGREIITLVDEVEKPGMHEVLWNGKNKHGIQVPTGIYFYRLKSDEGVISRKMLLVK